MEALYPENLLKLMEHDKDKNTDYVHILKVWLACSLNISETARQLYLHRNTLLYKLEQIKSIMGDLLTEEDSTGLFRNAEIYLGETENGYLTGKYRRKVYFGLYPLPKVAIPNEKVLLKDRQIFTIDDIKIECILMPGHTIGHMVYLIDDKYLFTGDTIWLGIDGGYSFLSTLAWSNKIAKNSLVKLEKLLRERSFHPIIITGHTGWTDDLDFAFAMKDKICGIFTKRLPDPQAPYDGYDESGDTQEKSV